MLKPTIKIADEVVVRMETNIKELNIKSFAVHYSGSQEVLSSL